MAKPDETLTVVFRVTDRQWSRRAAAAALMLYEHACPERVEIRRYTADGPVWQRVSSGYEVLLGAKTAWLLSIDADSYVCGDVRALVRKAARSGLPSAMRLSPLQQQARSGWNEDAYRTIFRDARVGYRPLATTCAFLLRRDVADDVLCQVGRWRARIDARGVRLSRAYHHAQAAFALALADETISEDRTWWWGPEELSFQGEDRGVIHHEAHKRYRFPFQRTADD